MRLTSSPILAGLFLSGWTVCLAADEPTPPQRAEAYRVHGLDPKSPLNSRVKPTSPAVLKMFEELGGPAPTAHALTEAERLKLSAAFAALPPLHRRVLSERLRSVNFLDGMPNTALTSTVNPDEPYRLYDLTIRAGILNETASEWYVQKERTNFDSAGSPLSVSVDAGQVEAILYILLHEGTHVVDMALELTPLYEKGPQPAEDPRSTEFTKGVWSSSLVQAPEYRDPLLKRTGFRDGGGVVPIDQAEAVYKALGKTPFASLYGSNNWHDDLAELLTLYHLTEKLKQPYRIAIRKDGEEVFGYEPLKSELVRGRFGLLKPFYDDKG